MLFSIKNQIPYISSEEICSTFLHWQYSPMRSFASIMDLLQTLGPRLHFWFPNRQPFLEWGCQPHAQPPTWRTSSHITPRTVCPSCTPRHWVSILVAFYDMHGVQWYYSLIPVSILDEEICFNIVILFARFPHFQFALRGDCKPYPHNVNFSNIFPRN